MHEPAPPRPKLAETVIEPTVKLREATIGRCCEVLGGTAIEYTELGDYSYRDVAPYTIVGGVPARQIRERFNREIAAQLSRIAWWNWPTETIWQRLPEFQSGDVEAFCARWI